MMIRIALALLIVLGMACSDPSSDVGDPCTVEDKLDSGMESRFIEYGDLDCNTGICLVVSGTAQNKPYCTKRCTATSECPTQTASCTAGYTCKNPLTQTEGEKLCVCNG